MSPLAAPLLRKVILMRSFEDIITDIRKLDEQMAAQTQRQLRLITYQLIFVILVALLCLWVLLNGV